MIAEGTVHAAEIQSHGCGRKTNNHGCGKENTLDTSRRQREETLISLSSNPQSIQPILSTLEPHFQLDC